ncbi:MAG: hypothetical protein KF784_14395 [Fimbriimonadaceae bacterium]|nr:hypothetical protein [Fimbriimonadaceae bacterium]
MGGWIRRTGIVIALASFASATTIQTSDTQKALDDALFVANASRENLRYPRVNPADKETLPFVAAVMHDPLAGIDTLTGLHQRASRPISQLLLLTRREVLGDASDSPPATIFIDDAVPDAVPTEFRASMQRLAGAIQASNTAVNSALSKLSSEEQRSLIESLPQWAAGEDVKFDFVKQKPLSMQAMRNLLGRVDLPLLRRTAESLAAVVEREIGTLKQSAGSTRFLGRVEGRIGNIPFVLAGKGDNVHNERGAMLTVDLGGNDRYIGRHGAGIGYASVFIDLDGDDTYDVPDASAGAGLLGIGLAYDYGGNDTCRGKSLCFGAGLAGVGAWYKVGGGDEYRSDSLSQGFGYFGIGICEDSGGVDVYTAQTHSQGSARTRGVGWLIDAGGDDVYRALGRESNSQGASSGFYGWAPEAAGGVGLLTDLKGSDDYRASDNAQGSGTERGLGSLYDAEGNDTYSGGTWCQASGNRTGAGYLFDSTGDDLYASLGGSCAFAGEESVAVLEDRAGADRYSSLGPSIVSALPSGTALLIDGGGVDVFAATAGNTSGSGFALLIDLGTAYRLASEFGGPRASSLAGGLHYSVPGGAAEDDTQSIPRITAQANSLPMPLTGEMELIFSRATQRAKPENLLTIGEARNRLVGIGKNGVVWMVERKLAGASEAELQVIGLVARTSGTEAINAVVLAVNSSDDAVAVGALRVSAAYRFSDAGALLKSALERPALQSEAIRTARRLRAIGVAPELMILTANQNRWLARIAADALAEIADPGSVGTAQALLSSPEWPIRAAAHQVLSQNAAVAFPIARAMASSGLEKEARLGLELLGRIGSAESLAEAAKGLKDQRPGVRVQALLALNGRFPKDALPQLAVLREDGDLRVRLVAQSVEVGR